MRRPLLRSRRSLQWSAAALAAVALYALPWALVVAIAGGFALYLAIVLVVLAVLAVRWWSPLAVLGASAVSLVGAFAFFLITASSNTCGDSTAAVVVAWIGGVALAVPLGAWGVRHGSRVFAAIPAGWVAAAFWFVIAAHLVHGGTGGCFE